MNQPTPETITMLLRFIKKNILPKTIARLEKEKNNQAS